MLNEATHREKASSLWSCLYVQAKSNDLIEESNGGYQRMQRERRNVCSLLPPSLSHLPITDPSCGGISGFECKERTRTRQHFSFSLSLSVSPPSSSLPPVSHSEINLKRQSKWMHLNESFSFNFTFHVHHVESRAAFSALLRTPVGNSATEGAVTSCNVADWVNGKDEEIHFKGCLTILKEIKQ